MVVQPKKNDPTKLHIYIDFKGLNKVTLTDPFPMPFVDEIINEVASHEFYCFTEIFSWYNQVRIVKEGHHKTTFMCEFRSFSYKVVSFVLNNALSMFNEIVVKEFQEYFTSLWVSTSTIGQYIIY